MIAWLRGIFFCSLDSVAYRTCGTSSLCFLLIWLSWISVSGHFVALRFAHLQHAFFFNDVSGSSHGESGALCHIAISDGRKSHLSGFLLDLARLRVLLACLKSYPVFFLLWTCCGLGHDLLGFNFVSARPLELVLRAAIFPFVVLLAHALRDSSCLVVVPLFILTRCPI